MFALLLSGAIVGCSRGEKEGVATAPGAAAPAAGQAEAAETGPAPFASPEAAFQALFEAMASGEREALEGALIRDEECLAMTGAPERCREMRLRNAAFLATQVGKPLPRDARLASMVLLRSFEIPTGGSADKAPTKVQLGSLSIESGQGTTRMSNVAAIQVQGGWRIAPGRAVLPERPDDDGK